MTLQRHPDCEYCNRPPGPFTPSDFVDLFGYAPSTKEQIDLPPEVVMAAADADRLVDEFQAATSEWTAAISKLHRLHPADPSRADAERLERMARVERERLAPQLSKARAHYHKVLTGFMQGRRSQEYADDVARRVAELEVTEEAGATERRSLFKQIVGRNKAVL